LDQVVHEWAVTNSISFAQALDVYDSWRDMGLTIWTDASLRNSLSSFFLHVREAERSSSRYKEHFDSQRSAWALEAIKHVALINLAGTAGVLTLQSTNSAKASLSWPLILFLIGALVSVLTFLIGALVYASRSDLEGAHALKSKYASSWSALTDASTTYRKGLDALREKNNAWTLSIITALAFTIGGAVTLACIQFG
jgi:hypothetical protein